MYRDVINLKLNGAMNEDIFTVFFNSLMNFIIDEYKLNKI